MSTWAAQGAKIVVLDAGTAANKVGLDAVRCSSVLYSSDSGVTGAEVTICDSDSQLFKTGNRSTGRALPFQAWRGSRCTQHIGACPA